MYKLLFVSGVVAFGMYGCGSFKGSGVVIHDEKPPYYHGHVEDEPPPSHQRMHAEPPPSDMCTATGAYPTNDKNCCSVIYVQKNGPM
jgi:hypothetical protein